MEGYTAKVKYASKELTAKERIAIKDSSSVIKLDDAVKEDSVVITVDYYAIISIHNDKSDTKDYDKIVLVDKVTGKRYTTGSRPFINTFENIFEEMEGEVEEWSIMVFAKESQNYKGKYFLTCSIV